MNKYRIIFLGTPEFAVPALKALISNGLLPIAVITEPDRPAGRGKKLTESSVKIFAKKQKIPVFQPKKIKNLKLKIKNLQPQVAIAVAYGQIIPQEILEIPKFGFLNIHPSLLPKYRGPSPIQATILNGDKETGVTIIKLDPKLDHGPILTNSKLKILNSKQIQNSNIQNNKLNYLNLSNDLADLGADLLIKILPDYLEGKIKPRQQDHKKASYTKLIKKSDGEIDWNKPIANIDQQVRAYNPWPGSYTILNEKRLKICQTHIEYDKLVIDQVQMEGKNKTNWQDFLRGYKKPIFFIDKIV